eukprot:2510472-Rhodomonas_salina.1
MSGTDAGYAATACARPTRCPVLTYCALLPDERRFSVVERRGSVIPIVLRSPYVVPGTDLGHAATHSLCNVRLCCYAVAMRNPVLTADYAPTQSLGGVRFSVVESTGPRLSYAMSGTDIAYPPRLSYAMPSTDIRFSYAMFGTGMWKHSAVSSTDAATTVLCHVRVGCYGLATACPVLRAAMLLLLGSGGDGSQRPFIRDPARQVAIPLHQAQYKCNVWPRRYPVLKQRMA